MCAKQITARRLLPPDLMSRGVGAIINRELLATLPDAPGHAARELTRAFDVGRTPEAAGVLVLARGPAREGR